MSGTSWRSEVVRALVPTGMLGGGFPAETIERGITMGADIIAVDGGSTDSGPHFLGSATAKTARAAVARDLSVIVPAAHAAGIPTVVGSCGTSGTDAGVDWVYDILCEVAAARGLVLRVALIYSEQRADDVETFLREGRVHPLQPSGQLTPETLRSCSHIVGVMGHEPIARALEDGADVVLAGRATDTALVAALPLMNSLPPGQVWHAGKIAECGGFCTDMPMSGGVLVSIDAAGFTVEPLTQAASCTPSTVAAHMMYENADPYRLREPDGTLDTTRATYKALDARRVRVEGSEFEYAPCTIKLEGAAPVGFQTLIITGMRAPRTLERLDEWCEGVLSYLHHLIPSTFTLDAGEYDLQIRRYGHDAVLGAAEPDRERVPHEIGIVFMATAATQSLATQLAMFANPVLLHAPLAGESAVPSYAFLGSPVEVERGLVHEFVLNHVVDVDDPSSLFTVVHTKAGG
jgi:hypothetical protein